MHTSLYKFLTSIYENRNEISAMVYCNEKFLATGDDDGVIKIWDLRSKKCVFTEDELHADYISDLDYNDEKKLLYASRYLSF